MALEVFARGSDRQIYRRPYDGANWGAWHDLPGLDGTMVDARSDLDCDATDASVHLVATGLSPVGAFLHAFGAGTAYNPFVRELPDSTFDPGPSIASGGDTTYTLAALASTRPIVYEFGGMPSPRQITPITTATNFFRSGPDIAIQPSGGTGLTYFVAFDDAGALAVYYRVLNSGDDYWATGIKLSAPAGTFAFSPTICTENGGYGVSSVNLAAVADGKLWYAKTISITAGFSGWIQIGADVASSPDCAVAGGPDSIVHVVALSSTGSILDVQGKGTSWGTMDLGLPP
jgi:hypothetical protein